MQPGRWSLKPEGLWAAFGSPWGLHRYGREMNQAWGAGYRIERGWGSAGCDRIGSHDSSSVPGTSPTLPHSVLPAIPWLYVVILVGE